jgi:hypothetical protein
MIRSAQLAVSRQEGMKFISRKSGEEILAAPLLQGISYLTVALPQKAPPTNKPSENSSPSETILLPQWQALTWYHYLLFGFLGLGVAGLIYIFFLG